MSLVGVVLKDAELREQRCPLIVRLNESHFVVILQFCNDGARIATPVQPGEVQIVVMPYKKLFDEWDGRTLIVRGTKD